MHESDHACLHKINVTWYDFNGTPVETEAGVSVMGAGILVAWSQQVWALVQMELVVAASVKKEESVQKESVQRESVHMVSFVATLVQKESVQRELVNGWMNMSKKKYKSVISSLATNTYLQTCEPDTVHESDLTQHAQMHTNIK